LTIIIIIITVYNVRILAKYKNLADGGEVAAYPLRSAVTRHLYISSSIYSQCVCVCVCVTTEEKEKTNMVQCTPAAHKPVEDTTKLSYSATILCVSVTIG